MPIQLQITLHGVTRSAALEDQIRRRDGGAKAHRVARAARKPGSAGQ